MKNTEERQEEVARKEEEGRRREEENRQLKEQLCELSSGEGESELVSQLRQEIGSLEAREAEAAQQVREGGGKEVLANKCFTRNLRLTSKVSACPNSSFVCALNLFIKSKLNH